MLANDSKYGASALCETSDENEKLSSQPPAESRNHGEVLILQFANLMIVKMRTK